MSTDDTTNEDPAHPYETEDSFHPMGEEWESQMREQLEETEFDADLGMQMARDAQRLVAGELTEQEFYAEYHEDVNEEFDVDDRPVLDDLDIDDPSEIDELAEGSMLSSLGDIDLEADEATRRDVMKKMGAGAAFLGYSAYASYDNQQEDAVPQDISGITPADEDEREHRWGMVIDLERCDGCLACVSGCVDENATSTGANWMYVFPYENEDADPNQQNFLVRPCQHCSNAPCAKVCPVRARHTRSKDGLVLTDYETCIGCRYCQVACPYGVNYFQWGEPDVPMEEIDQADLSPSEVRDLDEDERQQVLSDANDHVYDERGRWVDSRPPQGVMGKCTMCPSRQDDHTENPKGTVACMDACDEQGMSAIHFGDLDDPDSRANEYLRRRSEEHEQRGATKFDADLSFDVNTEETIDVSGGAYPLYLREFRDVRDDWRLLDSSSVVVAGAGEFVPESDDFAESSMADLGGIPSERTSVLSTTDDDIGVDVTLVFDDDELEDATERDVDISLRLVGAAGETVAQDTVTLREEADEVNGQLQREQTLTVDGTEVGVPEDEVYALLLLVEEETDEGVETRLADSQRVFVAEGQPTRQRPDPPYDTSRLEGELDAVPDILFADEETTIEATVAYPNRPQTFEMELVLDDSTITTAEYTDEGGDTIAALEYEFSQQRTSNTPWDGKLSSYRLLEEMGTEPNIIYLGDEPGPEAEQVEGPVGYDDIRTTRWGEWMSIKDNRKEHLDYGAGAHQRAGTGGD